MKLSFVNLIMLIISIALLAGGVKVFKSAPEKRDRANEINARSTQVIAVCTYVDWDEEWDDNREEWRYVYYPLYEYEYEGEWYNYHGSKTYSRVYEGDRIELNITPERPHKASRLQDGDSEYFGARFGGVILIILGAILLIWVILSVWVDTDKHNHPYMGMGGGSGGMGGMGGMGGF